MDPYKLASADLYLHCFQKRVFNFELCTQYAYSGKYSLHAKSAFDSRQNLFFELKKKLKLHCHTSTMYTIIGLSH